jgi:transposase-like protein
VGRAMKVQEAMLRAMAKNITWWQTAEIIGISDRQMRRWRERYEEFGYDGLFDRRPGTPSPKRVPPLPWNRCWGCIGSGTTT